MQYFQESSPTKSTNENPLTLEEDSSALPKNSDFNTDPLTPLYEDLQNKINACSRITTTANDLKQLKNTFQDVFLHALAIIQKQTQTLKSKENLIQLQTLALEQKDLEITELKDLLAQQQTVLDQDLSELPLNSTQTKQSVQSRLERPLELDQGVDSLALSLVSSPKSRLTAYNTPIPMEKFMEVESPMPEIILESLEDLKKDEVILSEELIQLEKALIKMKPRSNTGGAGGQSKPPKLDQSFGARTEKRNKSSEGKYSNMKYSKQKKIKEIEVDLEPLLVEEQENNIEDGIGYDDFFADNFGLKESKPYSISYAKNYEIKKAQKEPVTLEVKRVKTEENKKQIRDSKQQSRSPEILKGGRIKKELNLTDLQGLSVSSKEQKSVKSSSTREENRTPTPIMKTIVPSGYYSYSNIAPGKLNKNERIIQISKSQILQNIQNDSINNKTSSGVTDNSLNVTCVKSSPIVEKTNAGFYSTRGKNPMKERNIELSQPRSAFSTKNSHRGKPENNNSARFSENPKKDTSDLRIKERMNTFESLAQENSELYKDIEVLTTSNKNIFRNLLNQAGFGIFPHSPTLQKKPHPKVSQSYNFAESSCLSNKEIVLNLDLSAINPRSGGQSMRSKPDSVRQADKQPRGGGLLGNENKMRDVHGRKFVLRDKTNDENVNKSMTDRSQLVRRPENNNNRQQSGKDRSVVGGNNVRESSKGIQGRYSERQNQEEEVKGLEIPGVNIFIQKQKNWQPLSLSKKNS